MVTVGLLVTMQAKEGKEEDVRRFLMEARALADAEDFTPHWFAVRLGPSEFAIVDFFADEPARQAHLQGKIAEALMAEADNLLASPPQIRELDVLGAKVTAPPVV
jgi:quinol monooxygenase YgiN